MDRCAPPRQTSDTTPPLTARLDDECFGLDGLSTTPSVFGVSSGADDPVLVERRDRRRRAVIAGLIAIALLVGGMAVTVYSAPARPPVVQHQARVNQ